MDAIQSSELKDKEKAEALVASQPLIPEVESIDVHLYTDHAGEAAFQLIFHVRSGVIVDKTFIKRFNEFAGRVQTAILHSDLHRFPYTRLEQGCVSFARDLMEQADHLVQLERTRPKQASLRRAISTAYYGLFHLLTGAAASLIAPDVPEPVRHRVQRWFDHGEMRKVCNRFLANELTYPLADLIGTRASEQMQLIARAFVDLQDARHRADYDLSWSVTRGATVQYIGAAWDAFEAWEEVRNTAETNIFLLSLLLWKNWERERQPDDRR